MTRLRRADCSGPGITRRRAGRGFAYYDDDGRARRRARGARAHPRAGHPAGLEGRLDLPVSERSPAGDGRRRRRPQAVPLPRRLAHPPRRGEVRRHDALRARRCRGCASRSRPTWRPRTQLTRERVLACAVRLLDRGFFRIGTEEYTVTNESYGLATIRKAARDDRATARWSSTTPPRAASGASRPSSTRWRRRSSARSSAAAAAAPELLAYKAGRAWVRPALRRHQRLPQGRRPATTSRPRTSAPGARP